MTTARNQDYRTGIQFNRPDLTSSSRGLFSHFLMTHLVVVDLAGYPNIKSSLDVIELMDKGGKTWKGNYLNG